MFFLEKLLLNEVTGMFKMCHVSLRSSNLSTRCNFLERKIIIEKIIRVAVRPTHAPPSGRGTTTLTTRRTPLPGQDVVLKFETTPTPESEGFPRIVSISQDAEVLEGNSLVLTCVISNIAHMNVSKKNLPNLFFIVEHLLFIWQSAPISAL